MKIEDYFEVKKDIKNLMKKYPKERVLSKILKVLKSGLSYKQIYSDLYRLYEEGENKKNY